MTINEDKQQQHNNHTKKIWESPATIGLEHIAVSSRETKLFHYNKLYHQPDNLCFDPSVGILYNIEYKTSTARMYRGVKQLLEQNEFLKEVFNQKYKIVNLYVHDDYQTSVL